MATRLAGRLAVLERRHAHALSKQPDIPLCRSEIMFWAKMFSTDMNNLKNLDPALLPRDEELATYEFFDSSHKTAWIFVFLDVGLAENCFTDNAEKLVLYEFALDHNLNGPLSIAALTGLLWLLDLDSADFEIIEGETLTQMVHRHFTFKMHQLMVRNALRYRNEAPAREAELQARIAAHRGTQRVSSFDPIGRPTHLEIVANDNAIERDQLDKLNDIETARLMEEAKAGRPTQARTSLLDKNCMAKSGSTYSIVS